MRASSRGISAKAESWFGAGRLAAQACSIVGARRESAPRSSPEACILPHPIRGDGFMPVLMSCPRGHQWEDLFDDQLSLQDGKSHCPVCGIALERLPANLAAEAALLPSTRQIHASTSVAGEKTSPEICLEPVGYDPEPAAAG